ncbi:type IV pilin protein [Luteimonas terrae]|uniref:Type IV pilin protein n=2 Tax=Luteimonas terrae TaxID=1530191 RepID=A0A4R5UFI9_9GAMM|nr:type IV pilin protein [Luteimonas terrae]TDK34117.1 type IV pilin protein [Luteimonas terrae]
MEALIKARRVRPETPQRGLQGFTLIELMIVVAVIAILASIALPAYQDAIRKGRRGQAKADLVDLAQVMERYRTVQGRYATAIPSGMEKSPRTGTAWYDISFTSTPTDTAFQLQAVPKDAQRKDVRCMTLTLNQAGKKDIAGGATGTAQDCW